MIKQKLKIKLIKNFKMEYTQKLVLPNVIREKDIYAMFSGLLTLTKQLAENNAKKTQLHNEYSYKILLKMYLNAVKEKNKYKSLCKTLIAK